jgi:hypothetical protein
MRQGTHAEEIGSEGPSGLEAEVDVGGVDESTAAETHEDGADGEDAVGLVWQIVEGDEGVAEEAGWVILVDLLGVGELVLLLVGVFGGPVVGRVEGVLHLGQWGAATVSTVV